MSWSSISDLYLSEGVIPSRVDLGM